MLNMLVLLSLRNLYNHKITSGIVGTIIFVGTWLSVCGTACIGSLEHTLSSTLIHSIAGHLQIYSSRARDELALFGSGFSAMDDLGEIDNFAAVRQELMQDKNVRAVIPMGIAMHAVLAGNELDQTLQQLQRAAERGDAARLEASSVVVRDMARDMEQELLARAKVAGEAQEVARHLAAVRRVQSPIFWQQLRARPERYLQFLDSQLAPLAGTAPPFFLRNIGTDLTLFSKHFSRFRLIDGQMVPPLTRGLLLSKRTYETQLKHPVARSFDLIHDALGGTSERSDMLQGPLSIAQHPALKDEAERLVQQYQRITFQLSPEDGHLLSRALRAHLHDNDADLNNLVRKFLQLNDSNFAARHAFFYATIAPKIQLYAVKLGDHLTLQAETQAGYIKSVQVPVWGTFEFTGLDRSGLTLGQNLLDMVSFRALYGAPDAAQEREMQALRKSFAVADVGRDDVEAQMFTATQIDAERAAPDSEAARAPEMHLAAPAGTAAATFQQEDVDNSYALHAAVVLHDGGALAATQSRLQARLQRAGMPVQVVDWRAASGLLSAFIKVVHLFLYMATGVVFLVALVIMSNAVTMATTERSREIGTIRAIGGQRSLVLGMALVETMTLGLVAGSAGAVAAWVTVRLLHRHGVAAVSDVMVFLFAGPRFYPDIALHHVVVGLCLTLAVALASTLYPARLAARISPVIAMAQKE